MSHVISFVAVNVMKGSCCCFCYIYLFSMYSHLLSVFLLGILSRTWIGYHGRIGRNMLGVCFICFTEFEYVVGHLCYKC